MYSSTFLSSSLAGSNNFAPRHHTTEYPSDSPRAVRVAHRSRGPGLLTAAVLTASIVVAGCSPSSGQSLSAQSGPTGAGSSQDVRFTVGYAGDVLMHMPVLSSTPEASGDITDNVAAETPWVEGLDLALCGMEVRASPPSALLPRSSAPWRDPGGTAARPRPITPRTGERRESSPPWTPWTLTGWGTRAPTGAGRTPPCPSRSTSSSGEGAQ